MYSWRLQTKIEQCEGIVINHKQIYTILARLDNNFSQQSSPARIFRNKLQFKTSVLLQFDSKSSELPSNNLQILLIKNESRPSNEYTKGSANNLKNDEQIIGIASIKLNYPLMPELQKINTYTFDRSFEKQSSIRLSLSLQRSATDKNKLNNNQGSYLSNQVDGQPWISLLRLQIQKNKEYERHLNMIYQEIMDGSIIVNLQDDRQAKRYDTSSALKDKHENKIGKNKSKSEAQLQKERDQLYRLSENLYRQLKEVTQERDELFKELREKQLEHDQFKQQLDLLKSSMKSYGKSTQESQVLNSQLQFYKNQSRSLNAQLQKREKEVTEMERKIKESLIAVQNFRKEASEARKQLISKQLSYSNVSRGSRYLDPVEIIQQLSYEIRNRKIGQVHKLQPLQCNKLELDSFYKVIEKQMTVLITQLIAKLPAQKMLLTKRKSQILLKVQELTFNFSLQK